MNFKMDERYGKHILLKEIGREGQKKLMESNIVIIGCGATGSASAINMVRSGIGEVTVCLLYTSPSPRD